MQMSELKSCRYQPAIPYDRFTGVHVFVQEARKYSSVLECGCSSGFVSRLIGENGGPKVVGIEYDSEAAAEARRFCERVLTLDLNHPGWSGQVGDKFDLVTFGDVLEHLVDPAATLRETKQVLNPGGRILISLPNIAHWSMRAKLLFGGWEYQPTGLMDYTHLRFFTTVTGRRMIEDAGYRIIFSHPITGGRFTSRFRAGWQVLANLFPNVFAMQMIFLAEVAP